MTATNFAPRDFSRSSPSFIGFDEWSSATPHSRKKPARSQSGSPNSQKLWPTEYSPPAAMLTEQKPPWAAQLSVPNCVAQKPLSACIWSRPVKNASRFGSVDRMSPSRSASIVSARSHEIGSNCPAPRSVPARRSSGRVSFAGLRCFMIPALPLAHSTPRLTGWSGLPSMWRTSPSSTVTRMPQRHAHM